MSVPFILPFHVYLLGDLHLKFERNRKTSPWREAHKKIDRFFMVLSPEKILQFYFVATCKFMPFETSFL